MGFLFIRGEMTNYWLYCSRYSLEYGWAQVANEGNPYSVIWIQWLMQIRRARFCIHVFGLHRGSFYSIMWPTVCSQVDIWTNRRVSGFLLFKDKAVVPGSVGVGHRKLISIELSVLWQGWGEKGWMKTSCSQLSCANQAGYSTNSQVAYGSYGCWTGMGGGGGMVRMLETIRESQFLGMTKMGVGEEKGFRCPWLPPKPDFLLKNRDQTMWPLRNRSW